MMWRMAETNRKREANIRMAQAANAPTYSHTSCELMSCVGNTTAQMPHIRGARDNYATFLVQQSVAVVDVALT